MESRGNYWRLLGDYWRLLGDYTGDYWEITGDECLIKSLTCIHRQCYIQCAYFRNVVNRDYWRLQENTGDYRRLLEIT